MLQNKNKQAGLLFTSIKVVVLSLIRVLFWGLGLERGLNC